ncbi:alpha/beta fold hydrolase [uncultured Ramlibacter sp.]|uniref:alpha/beta fold hydrolase n=1 Tax=uncultured Ramlibacter sp. TaxID=260755 RepID=UPI00261B220B|nr:alpha/beta fold hydrolase [uncultured Ramlibacter sp.]
MTTWLLLRGLAREAGHWGDFEGQLAAALGEGHHVLALDLPGNGALHGQRSPADVAAMARALRAQAVQRGLAPPYVLVAMSLGAMVALEWGDSAPQELAGCVLVNTSLGGHSPFWQRLLPHNYLRLASLLRPGLSALEREARVLAMTSSHSAGHPGVAQRWAAIAQQRPVRRGNLLRQLLAAARYTAPQLAPPVALLVLCSDGDRLVSPSCSWRLAERWCVPLQVHPHAGHDLPLDAPAWVLARIHGWWQLRTALGELSNR